MKEMTISWTVLTLIFISVTISGEAFSVIRFVGARLVALGIILVTKAVDYDQTTICL
jgi:uncharacterized membrane protein